MNCNALIKKLKLSEKDFQLIKDTVVEVETKTKGEIAVALAPESAHYSFWELLFSTCVSFIVAIILLPFSNQLYKIWQQEYWQFQPIWILPAFYILICLLIIVLFFYIFNIPCVDRFVVPPSVKRVSVTHRAFRYFTESGIYDTENHCGILIYVSFMERQVRIIADKGISEKISQDLWNLIADELAENLKNKKTTEAFINAINKCGDLLREYFPSDIKEKNELSDGLVILGNEDSEWF